MGKKADLSGVRAKGSDRIQFDFEFEGVRYRPTLKRIPSEANLRRAYKQLQDIKGRIERGLFKFEEEFPDYRYRAALSAPEDKKGKTCDDVFRSFLANCEMRVAMDDMSHSTLHGYRKILESVWSPRIGTSEFQKVIYSELAGIAAAHTKKKKTYNNVVSAVRTAFKFGYRDYPGKFNPALALPTFRITKKDRPKVDPFAIEEAETVIAASHGKFGEPYGNYEEFRFFTGLRQSEQFALEVGDCDLVKGSVKITKAVVLTRKKNRTKTNQDREIDLCPRALEVLRQQLVLREQMVATGKIHHECVFFTEDGEPFRTIYLPYNRWRRVMKGLGIRYRKPYNSRHSFISWRLMIGHNRLLVAQEDGHSVSTMERTYAAWIKGGKADEVERIKAAMASRPRKHGDGGDGGPSKPLESPQAGTTLAPAGQDGDIRVPAVTVTATRREALSACSSGNKSRESTDKDLAGVAGFEPTYGGIKTRCLTTWRHPNT